MPAPPALNFSNNGTLEAGRSAKPKDLIETVPADQPYSAASNITAPPSFRRNWLGGSPMMRLNARLKEASAS